MFRGERLRGALAVYVLTDRGLSRGRTELEVVRQAIDGGATAIQLRWKSGSLHEAVAVGSQLREMCRDAAVMFVVNDRVDLAVALEADAVHLGDEDLPIREARKIVGDDMVIGYSPATLVDALQAPRLGADYLGVGPVYGTKTKSDAGEAVGVRRIQEVCDAISIPVVGIGGIDAENAADVVYAGAAGVAVISSVVAADDIRDATQRLRRAVESALPDSK
ncbi:MAG: thiamine phosphate synthase [Nitrolancea sp.]